MRSRHPALEHVHQQARGGPMDRQLRVTLHFHPDARFEGGGILAAMRRDGRYRSQFETRTSNGGLTAFPQGARWQWESRLFNGFYDQRDGSERPKYGSLNFRGDAYGGSPRFGSSYFRLTEEVLDRSSFCFPDSVFEPTSFGTSGRMALMGLAEATAFADPLDWYVEAHVHGDLRLPDDVEALVLDPSYRGTLVEGEAHALGIRLEWHPGYAVTLDVLSQHPGYRGDDILRLAERIADDARLTPFVLGRARSDTTVEPQPLKKLWHCVARFGRTWDWPAPTG
ncbi:DUF3626 domain-containing protein [Corallococcus carmarthensis]|uniref:DUF3626 domain-containing protein n=1 Tax=Corallococcus carmarthensis TaxID=2316728 RepID=A0A3A8K2H8_9BACT|nr:DUF3626 domain-containing protein [Corallococcus carmarthensis]NOK19943.1 DUF3626 domain-containing protein [Corallococcus carmarthensis]RKH01487.1 DUF3626 domain-containing protein [Corallococcus carmarthensis]